jgi:hypothetical protein
MLGAVALCISKTVAFPAAAIEYAAKAERDANAAANIAAAVASHRANYRAPTFNATAQYVSTHGQYEFVAPNLAGGDNRGPCPGISSLYLPHLKDRHAVY